MFRKLLFIFLFCISLAADAKPPVIDTQGAGAKIQEIMESHVSHKNLTPTLIKRSLVNFVEELDPTKTYFVESDIKVWLDPNDETVNEVLKQVKRNDFSTYMQIYETMLSAIDRRNQLETMIDMNALPEKVDANQFKDLDWVKSEQDLLARIMEVRSLQIQTSKRLNDELQEKSIQRIQKQRKKYEEELLNCDPTYREQLVLSKVLKAFASSMDTHTSYFTPEEAQQFLINVQQRLFGIGAALRDDINGFRVIKVVEGGPADRGGELKKDDLIIAVDGEPVVGMSIIDAVGLIRGEKDTPVKLTVIRNDIDDEDAKEETLDITVIRGEVVLKETRYEVSYEPFGNGVVAYLKLFSFYQDPENSSAEDLTRELEKIKEDHRVLGVVLDLRNNSGGMLSQAVAVTGLFITKGVVVSIKDDSGRVQHLRDLDGRTIWNGPLIVLINRGSASASEIVAQTLQDYGRAIIVGDDHSFGKGSFQTFTLNASGQGEINPEGEYKVTRGRYYTVSGKSPQLVGVLSDIEVPGALSESEIGEQYAKFPLETDKIEPNFDDDLSDVPFFQRAKLSNLYKFNLQPKLTMYEDYIPVLKSNSGTRIENNKNYQAFLEEVNKQDLNYDPESDKQYGKNDLQLIEAMNIMKDLILLQRLEKLGGEEPELQQVGA